MKIEFELRKSEYRSWLLTQRDDEATSEHSFSSRNKCLDCIKRCLSFYKLNDHFKITIETAPDRTK